MWHIMQSSWEYHNCLVQKWQPVAKPHKFKTIMYHNKLILLILDGFVYTTIVT